jgi:hypothetical protein
LSPKSQNYKKKKNCDIYLQLERNRRGGKVEKDEIREGNEIRNKGSKDVDSLFL